MLRVTLPGHYGRAVDVDLCAPCHLVWFDLTETARLTGEALLGIIGHMALAQRLPHELLRPAAGCPRCGNRLKTVHNQSRWGASLQLECVLHHGAYQSFAQFLHEKGLLRAMSRIDRAKLLRDSGRIDCVNCGAALGVADERCAYCQSVPSLLDVARLAHALDPEGALVAHAVHSEAARQAALQCAACGAALPADDAVGCAQCGATLAISSLAEAHHSVEALAPALRAHALKPAPQVVMKRLAALDADLPRRREWAASLEAEARGRRGTGADDFDWGSLWSGNTNPLRAVLVALAIWFLWWFWPRH